MTDTYPTGRLTLVFTDIQGSTDLWERLGEQFVEWLNIHNQLLRECIQQWNGYEVKTEGDAFMIAFFSEFEALRWSLTIQEKLNAIEWPKAIGNLLVRVGIHTGEPICTLDPTTGRMDYFGPMVNRAARVSGAGHGDQILLSDSTFIAVKPHLKDEVVENLSEHRLKGLDAPEHLWQVLPDSLKERQFPPLKTLTAIPTNLPLQQNSFIGRKQELKELSELLCQSDVNLVTLMGPGGTGKSRLSLRIGNDLLDHFEGGCWFVDLSEAQNQMDIIHKTALAFGVPLIGDKVDENNIVNLLEFRKPLLIILDNFEQIVQFASQSIGLWTQKLAHVKFLVTSRALLNIRGERKFQLQPLPVPEKGTGPLLQTIEISQFESVGLFVERAQEIQSDFSLNDSNSNAIAEICSTLEGMPLAIELAAARIKILSPQQIVSRLNQKFKLLRSQRRDLSNRQQALWNAIEWSYNLLEEWEKSAFLQLSQLNGFFMECAEEVLDMSDYPEAPFEMDIIQSLKEKSILKTIDTPYGPRFSMFVMLKEYAQHHWEKVISESEKTSFYNALAQYFANYTKHWSEQISTHSVVEALEKIELEFDNLQQLKHFCIAHHQYNVLMSIIYGLAQMMRIRWSNQERLNLLKEVEPYLSDKPGYLLLLSLAYVDKFDIENAQNSLNLAQTLFNESEPSNELAELYLQMGRVAYFSSHNMSNQERLSKARDCYKQVLAIARITGNKQILTKALFNIALTYSDQEAFDEALHYIEQAESTAREMGYLIFMSHVLNAKSLIDTLHYRFENAQTLLQEAIGIAKKINHYFLLTSNYIDIGNLYFQIRKYEESNNALLEGEKVGLKSGLKYQLVSIYYMLGENYIALNHLEPAKKYYNLSLQTAKQITDTSISQGVAHMSLGRIAYIEGNEDLACEELLMTMHDFSQDTIWKTIFLLYPNVMLAKLLKDKAPEKARDYFSKAQKLMEENPWRKDHDYIYAREAMEEFEKLKEVF